MEEKVKDKTKECALHGFSRDDVRNHIELFMPFAVKPIRKKKHTFVAPFTSENAKQICIDTIVNSLFDNGFILDKDTIFVPTSDEECNCQECIFYNSKSDRVCLMCESNYGYGYFTRNQS